MSYLVMHLMCYHIGLSCQSTVLYSRQNDVQSLYVILDQSDLDSTVCWIFKYAILDSLVFDPSVVIWKQLVLFYVNIIHNSHNSQ